MPPRRLLKSAFILWLLLSALWLGAFRLAPAPLADDDDLALMERATALDLGRIWRQSENGWVGVWTRRGTSNTFDAVWTKDGHRVTAVLTMKLQAGGGLTILRRDTSDNLVVDYAGTIGKDRRVTGTGKVRGGIGPYPWSARIEGGAHPGTNADAPARPAAPAPASPPTAATPALTASLGRVWQEHENGWDGVWTRRGNSNVFDAVWTRGAGRVQAVLTMTLSSGNQVVIHRRDSNDGVQVDYVGTIDRQGRVTGTGRIVGSASTFPWHATIDGGVPQAAAAGLGRVWHEQENGWSGVWSRRGESNTFDATWTKDGARVTAVLTMALQDGDRVSIHRRDTSDSEEVDYDGTIDPDGRVHGTGRVRRTGWSFPWTATIQR